MHSVTQLWLIWKNLIKTKSLNTKQCPAGLSPRIIRQVSHFLTKMSKNCCTHQVWTVPLYDCNFMLKLRCWTLSNQYIVNQITRPIYWTKYCIVFLFSMQDFGKLGFNLNGLVVKVLDSQSRSPVFKTIGWIQGWLSLSPFWGWSNKCQEFLGTSCYKVNCLLRAALSLRQLKTIHKKES